jgi:phosphatidylglycerol:prolipoprotein diacylglycerol transferase
VYPILLQWGPLVVPSWHAFYALGAIAAWFLMRHLARRYEPSLGEGFLARLYLIAYVGGWFGARLFSVLFEDFSVSGFSQTVVALFTFGSMTFYGGAIGAFVPGALWVAWKKVSVGRVADVAIPAGVLALALGRIGCFLNGDDYGVAVSRLADGSAPWWSVTIPVLEDGVPRVPVQLISAGLAATLSLFLCLRFKSIRQKMPPGSVAWIGIGFYASGRFAIEYLRGDPRGSIWGDFFSPAQIVSLVILGILLAISPILAIRRER